MRDVAAEAGNAVSNRAARTTSFFTGASVRLSRKQTVNAVLPCFA
jgi:hypothetical protein